MRNILFIIQKEFIQIFRNKVLMVMLFVIPFVQLLILPFAASFEIKNINLHIVDYSRSTYSQKLISKFSGSSFYNITDISSSYQKAENEIKSGKVNQIIVIPFDFEKNIVNSKKSKIQINTDAVNANAAGLMNAYSMSIIRDFNSNINIIDNKSKMPVNVEYSYWYNPELKYSTYMVPGILVLLITIIGIFLTTMNIVKEKETGTIEQINVTPIKKYEFIIGKLIPFWIIALFELALGLLIGRFVYSIHITGSVFLIFIVAGVYLFSVLGIGLFFSTTANTGQQAIFTAWFFVVVFILMSGLFTPIESMPVWAQRLNIINPVAYFIRINRMIILKGSEFKDIIKDFSALCVYAVLMLSLAVWRHRKVV